MTTPEDLTATIQKLEKDQAELKKALDKRLMSLENDLDTNISNVGQLATTVKGLRGDVTAASDTTDAMAQQLNAMSAYEIVGRYWCEEYQRASDENAQRALREVDSR